MKWSRRVATNCEQVRSSRDSTSSSVMSVLKKGASSSIFKILFQSDSVAIVMLLEWGLISSVTLVSVTMLMIVGAFLAILPEAEQYYQVSRTKVLLFSNSFNIFYIIISPLIFSKFSKYYVEYVLASTIATGVAAVGRYFAQENYELCLALTAIVAIAHIPIITAPYGLLKLFPDSQKGYAASIPLFLPVLGINFCILYGMAYIAKGQNSVKSLAQTHSDINKLNGIIAMVGVVSTVCTVLLLLKLKDKIQDPGHNQVQTPSTKVKTVDDEVSTSTDIQNGAKTINEEVNLSLIWRKLRQNKYTTFTIIAWGSIVGVNWTYGSLFGIIFHGQNLTEKETALIGLAANLSSAFFSSLGTWIKNKFQLQNFTIIHYLNIIGISAAIVIQLSRFIPLFQNIYFLVGIIIVLRVGFSSFVSLAFCEMERDGLSSLVVSGFFFWIANVVNLLGMELVDLIATDTSLFILTVIVGFCIYFVHRLYLKEGRQM